MSNWDANTLLRSFIAGEGDAGVTCPRLQFATVTGKLKFSLDTLHLFLEGKQGSCATPNIDPWKKVIIQIKGHNREGDPTADVGFCFAEEGCGAGC